MIISKTPYRISFFGGGSDYPEWYQKFGGEVISTSINKYVYISIRNLPSFFKHKYRILYSRDEQVQKIENIKHKPVREILKYYKVKTGLEVHYDGDIPARTGVGSSSAFVVGFLNSIMALNKKNITKKNLAKKSIFLETKVLDEVVGSQDQIACAVGGFNNIKFLKNGSFQIKKIKLEFHKKNMLENNLFLVYSKIQRTAEVIAKSFVNNLSEKKFKEMEEINGIVKEAKLELKSNNISNFGKLLHESWLVKRNLSQKVSNNKIDELYNFALEAGAEGGKLLGAGGGGFFVFYVKKNKQKIFKKKMKKNLILPFKFDENGSEIIVNTNSNNN
ncbi:hypothetical protein N9419_02580 [Candidatus Pelagibacter sp.]|nr:hypothetical protein [Candidatus Pelagibacter sp.]